jgi:hypothetical protein
MPTGLQETFIVKACHFTRGRHTLLYLENKGCFNFVRLFIDSKPDAVVPVFEHMRRAPKILQRSFVD